MSKSIEVSEIPTFILSRLSKEILTKLKFSKNINNYKEYCAQALRSNMEDIICIKNIFSKIPTKKVIEINNIVNNNKMNLKKPKINITTKSLSRKQIIILINTYNSEIIGNFANNHIANINGYLKKAKLATIAKLI